MKKYCVCFCLILGISINAISQTSEGGLPWSMQEGLAPFELSPLTYDLPDWRGHEEEYNKAMSQGKDVPYLIGLFAPTDIRFPESGYMVTLSDGRKVWRTAIHIEDAPAIGFYYDEYKLPQGVKLYLSNKNGKQVIGSYTSRNNSEDYMFANEAVQGDFINIELDIEKGVSEQEIKLHMNRALVYFTSISYLKAYTESDDVSGRPTGDPDPYHLEGRSSHCMINAVCPQSAGYELQRKSSLQLIIPLSNGAGVCTGTMVNNTSNNQTDCKPYVLTASHCQEDGTGVTNATYAQWLFRFNFEKTNCTGGPDATVNTLSGANFRARTPYSQSTTAAVGMPDFLLLELRNAIPASWDVYFAGWDRSGNIPASLNPPQKYIGFHHPNADIKKMLFTQNATLDVPTAVKLDLDTNASEGGVSPGSSGHGLFDGAKRYIGIASVAGSPLATCGSTNITNPGANDTFFLTFVSYFKFASAWEFGTESTKQLKTWLDPINSGAITTETIPACSSQPTGINSDLNMLKESITIYPNPVTDGVLEIRTNFISNTALDISVISMTGSTVKHYHIDTAYKGQYGINVGDLSDGVYVVRFASKTESYSQKVLLKKH